ncbi:MAG TPA: BtrH N-terminal domain-containing protein [Bacteroidales bacterium]|nr:BtrH N-terminal domain-containing protein [Bacteroidales bacterium]HPS73277.1 BtrH N-terminal domain-containing protein [Bacteroidales bacterium]
MIKLNFEHRQAGHCESGVTSNLLNYYGLKISEPMAFGIGAGLFFSYLPFLKMQHAPVTSFRVWPGMVFKRATSELGVKSGIFTFRSKKESMDKLKSTLDSGIPVGMQVGTFHLPFFPPEYRMHYNMHNMVVYGYDHDTFFVSDTLMEKPVEISYDDLVRVRFAQGTFAPRGRMYYPYDVPESVDIRPAILSGIKKTAHNMVGIPIPLVGVNGIRYLSRQMRTWEKRYGEAKASYYLGQVLRMEEEIGTAGAGFRFIYGAFLEESAEVLNKPFLREMAEEMGENANKWREFSYLGSRNCKKRAKPEESYDMLADMLYACAGREEKIFKKLSRM